MTTPAGSIHGPETHARADSGSTGHLLVCASLPSVLAVRFAISLEESLPLKGETLTRRGLRPNALQQTPSNSLYNSFGLRPRLVSLHPDWRVTWSLLPTRRRVSRSDSCGLQQTAQTPNRKTSTPW
jgi:hypothetical protein